MAKTEHRQRSLALYETILKLKDLDECCKFFDDLCTPTELRSMEQRFDVAVYLQQGHLPHHKQTFCCWTTAQAA